MRGLGIKPYVIWGMEGLRFFGFQALGPEHSTFDRKQKKSWLMYSRWKSSDRQ